VEIMSNHLTEVTHTISNVYSDGLVDTIIRNTFVLVEIELDTY